MAELLVKAADYTHPDPTIDAAASYKRGYPVVVMEDGHEWGAEERLPKFAVLKFPGIPIAKLESYIAPQRDANRVVVRRRLWTIRWAALPAAARTKLQSTGQLVIAAGGYPGPADYTWAQIRAFLRNQQTGLDETAELA